MTGRWLISFLFVLGLAAAEPNENAQKYLERLRENPRPGVILDRFYAAWLETGNRSQLVDFLKSRAENGDAADWMILGFVQQRFGDYRAQDSFEKAADLTPNSAAAHFWRGNEALRRGASLQAVESLRTVRELGPKDADLAAKTLRLLGQALIRRGEKEEALKIWDEAMAAAPEDEDLREDVVELLWRERQGDEAIARLRESIAKTRDPYRATIWRLRLAGFLDASADREGALQVLGEALAASGRDSWVELSVFGSARRDVLPPRRLSRLGGGTGTAAGSRAGTVASARALRSCVG